MKQEAMENSSTGHTVVFSKPDGPRPVRSGFYRRHGKRALDLILTAAGLMVVWPVLVLVALLVRFRLGAPVLFSHLRPGFRGKPFRLYKFRSMTDATDAQGNLRPDAERLPPFGRLLRASSLDELPELWNILRGEMSLVGPRPLMMQYLERYSPDQMRRHDVPPGLTGWAQVNGRNALSWDEKFALDIWYVEHLSLWLDIKILLMTMRKVLVRHGVSAADHVTMPEFMGKQREGTPD